MTDTAGSSDMNSAAHDELRARIVRRVQARRWSVYQLSRRAGVDHASTKRFLAGEQRLRSDRMMGVLRALDLAIAPETWIHPTEAAPAT